MTVKPAEIVQYWHGVGPEKWFAVDAALDEDIRARFGPIAQEAARGEHDDWQNTVEGSLALLILLDQFPRNLYRGQAKAFATDAKALAIAQRALARGYDLAMPMGLRAFFYLPFMHSEDLTDQDRCVALIASRLGTASMNYPFALGHRGVIARFGRFPARNQALGRVTTKDEQDFLDQQARH